MIYHLSAYSKKESTPAPMVATSGAIQSYVENKGDVIHSRPQTYPVPGINCITKEADLRFTVPQRKECLERERVSLWSVNKFSDLTL